MSMTIKNTAYHEMMKYEIRKMSKKSSRNNLKYYTRKPPDPRSV